jgi:hypothetical protein
MNATLAPPADAHDLTLDEERRRQATPEQLALPTIDKRTSDGIELSISGTIKLDRSDPEDCQLVRDLQLGNEVALKIDGLVVERAGRTAHDRDGYFEGSTLVTKVKVTGISRPAGEGISGQTTIED